MSEVRLALCTFPDSALAERVAAQLVDRQLAACVNLLPGLRSIYRWQGKVETDSEVLAILKTTAAALPDLEAALTELHPYDVPEIVTLEPTRVNEPYAAWVAASVSELPERPSDK